MSLLDVRRHRAVKISVFSVLALSLSACSVPQPRAVTPLVLPQRIELSSGDSGILNYTPWYIHKWALEGPAGSGIGGGGRNALPVKENGRPSGGSGMCCTSYPHEWQPDLKLTVRWLVEKTKDGKTPGYWYKAENVRIPRYDGSQAGGVWGVFLPGDRVRIMIPDGIDPNGGNNPDIRPADNDPYVAQGVLDDEWNQRYRRGGNTQ
jgi:hypothetical protein